MIPHRTLKYLLAPLAAASLSLLAADSPRIAARPIPLGPAVDVTLRTGETSKGELLSFADGSLKIKLNDGTVVTRDGSDVVSVRFIGPEKPRALPPPPTAQETELSVGEIDSLIDYRRREIIHRNPPPNRPLPRPLTPREAAECERLRAKADLHINALEAEMPGVTSEEIAQARLNELGRYYFLYGQYGPNEIKAFVKRASDSIRNPAIKAKFNDAAFNDFWKILTDKQKKNHERAIERNMLDKIDRQTPPPDKDKTPPKPPAGKDF